jgi:NAD(P)-dependent dehydrogenase (short-subunit alcohol dehydrogenase family)
MERRSSAAALTRAACRAASRQAAQGAVVMVSSIHANLTKPGARASLAVRIAHPHRIIASHETHSPQPPVVPLFRRRLRRVRSHCRAAPAPRRRSCALASRAQTLMSMSAALVRSYATSKGGLVTLAKALAVELGPLGIRVNAVRTSAEQCLHVRLSRGTASQVLPAATNTPMLRAGFAGNPAGFDALSKFHPVGRICEPEEIAQFVAFLGDKTKSGFINGSALQIDGGIGGRLYDPN